MNIADLAILVISGFFFFRGYSRGLVKEAASLIGLLFGFQAANSYSEQLAPHLNSILSNPQHAKPAAYIIIFIGTMLLVSLAAAAISKLLKLAMIKWADSLFGGLFGLGKGILIIAILLFLVTMFTPKPDFLANSRLAPQVAKVTSYLSQYVPEDLKKTFERNIAPYLPESKKTSKGSNS